MKKISQEYRYFVKNNLIPDPSPERRRELKVLIFLLSAQSLKVELIIT